MGKCLVTKLNGIVNNSSIPRLGEMRFKVSKVDAPTEGTQFLGLYVNAPSKVEIIGDGYFTDKTLQENKGKSLSIDSTTNGIFVFSTSNVEVVLLGKYAINRLNFYYSNQPYDTRYSRNKSFDIGDLKYSTAINYLNYPDSKVSGDIANLKSLTALKALTLSNTQVPLTGNIGELSVLSKCTEMSINCSKLTGDLATLPSVCRFASFSDDKGSVFTWSTRSSSAKIIAIEGNATFDNIDKMLQGQAQCQVGFSSGDDTRYKTIKVAGNRTSASDAAVQALQSKGYTVSITPA